MSRIAFDAAENFRLGGRVRQVAPRAVRFGDALLERGRVIHFELARPTLHDIFVRIAAPDDAAVQAPSPLQEAIRA